jgi:RNA recognition motif-containing protein
MSKKLYVGGLPYSVTGSQLEEMLSKFGKVTSCNLIIDKYSGQSKGFGFVELEKDEEADEAIKELNGKRLGEREITVNVARPREERPKFDNRGGGSGRANRSSRRRSFH